MSVDSPLPLFPLHTTLVPGAAVGLRVFERRYLDLVRDVIDNQDLLAFQRIRIQLRGQNYRLV